MAAGGRFNQREVELIADLIAALRAMDRSAEVLIRTNTSARFKIFGPPN